MSSSFGSFDFSGSAKPAAGWFRAWWLGTISDASRPPLPITPAAYIKIVELWMTSPNGTRTIHVYTAAPSVRLRLPSGVAFATQPITAYGAPAVFYSVPYTPGILIAEALAADGATVLASDRAASWGAPAAIVLTIDAPSLATGTGSALYLDGTDVAVIRATVVDAAGNACYDASPTISFSITSGPARVVGTHNGDPTLAAPASSPSVPAYHGLARVIARVTLFAAGSADDRAAIASVNVDAGRGNSSTIATSATPPPASFTITAAAPGLASGSVSVPLSVDAADSVLAAAAASVGAADIGY